MYYPILKQTKTIKSFEFGRMCRQCIHILCTNIPYRKPLITRYTYLSSINLINTRLYVGATRHCDGPIQYFWHLIDWDQSQISTWNLCHLFSLFAYFAVENVIPFRYNIVKKFMLKRNLQSSQIIWINFMYFILF